MDEEEKFVRNRKTMATIGTVAFVILSIAIIIWAIVHFIYINGKVKVMVSYAPYEATVKLDDMRLKNNGNNWIAPGTYKVTVEFENFDTLTEEVTINEDTKQLYGRLLANNATGTDYAKKHIKDFQDIEAIVGKEAAEDGAKQREKWPIIKYLPIKDPHYTIGYSMPDLEHVNITVTASLAYRGLAINKLLQIVDDEDLGKYDVIFNDLKNPYTKPVANTESDVKKFIKASYPNYKFSIVGKETDDYYYAYLRHLDGNASEIFRIILKKDGKSWKIMSTPYPLLTKANTPDVPLVIINAVNAM